MIFNKSNYLIAESCLKTSTKEKIAVFGVENFSDLEIFPLSKLAFGMNSFNVALELSEFIKTTKKAFDENNVEKILEMFPLLSYFSDIVSVLEEDVDNLGLSNRSSNALIASDIYSLKDIFENEQNLSSLPRVGATVYEEIIGAIEPFRKVYNISKHGTLNLNEITHNDVNFVKFESFYSINQMHLSIRSFNSLKNEGIQTLLDIDKAKLDSISGLGSKCIREINNRRNEIYEDFNTFVFSDDSLRLSICLVDYKNVVGFQNTRYKSEDKSTVLDVYRKFRNDLESILKFDNVEDFNTYRLFRSLCSTPEELTSKLNALLNDFDFTERDLDIFVKRGSMTLQQIADYYNLKRQRIDQIDSNLLKSIKHIFEIENVLSFFRYSPVINPNVNTTGLTPELFRITSSRFADIFGYDTIEGDDGSKMFIEHKYFLDKYNTFKLYLSNMSNGKILSFQTLRDGIKDNFLLAYFLDLYKIQHTKYGYTAKVSKGDAVYFYLRNNNIVNISDNNITNIIDDIYNNYGIKIESATSLRGLLSRSAYYLGNNLYTFNDNDPIIPLTVLDDIFKDIIEQKCISSSKLFSKYKNVCSNLLSDCHLYFYLHKVYPNRFNFGGTNLMISDLGVDASYVGRIQSMIQEIWQPISFETITLKLNVNDVYIFNAIRQNKELIKYGKRTVFLKKLLMIDDEDKNIIDSYLCTTKNFSASDLYRYCLIKKMKIINNNFINDSETFFDFLINIGITALQNFNIDVENRIFSKTINNSNFEDDEFEI